MNLETYKELTGECVATSAEARYNAQIARTQAILESLLGYTLNPDLVAENLYIELGKNPTECSCSSVAAEDLLPADAVVNAYRLYPYNPKDSYLIIDPNTEVHAVKLVKDGVTIKTYEADEYRAEINRNGWSKALQICEGCYCQCNCNDCVQLAVDAEWLWEDFDELPDALKYLWTDSIAYFINGKDNVKSETIGPHSYTKFDKIAVWDEAYNKAILRAYAGGNGSIGRVPTL